MAKKGTSNTNKKRKEEIIHKNINELENTISLKKEEINEYYNILDQEKPHLLLQILLLIFLFIVGILLVYVFVIKDSKSIFSSGINKTYEIVANNIIKFSKSNILNNNFNLSGVLSIDSTNSDYSNLNNNLFNINLNVDKLKNKYMLDIETKESDKLLSHSKYYIDNNDYYLDLGNNYNKVIKLDSNLITLDEKLIKASNINYNKLNNAFKGIKNIIINNINRDKLELKETNINNKDYMVVTLKLNKNDYSSLISKVIYDIKENNSIMNNLVGAFNSNYENISDYLNEYNKKNLNNNFNEISYSFYASGMMSTIVGIQIKVDETQIYNYLEDDQDKSINIKYDNYELYLYKKDNKYTGKLLKDDTLFIELIFKDLSYEKIDVDYKNYEDNSYGNFYINKYSEENNTSGNIKYSKVTKKDTSSFNFDYRFEKYNDFKINDYINVNDISKEEKDTIIKNIKYSYPNKKIQDYYLKIIK